jgi:hypothetical protein
MEDGFVEGFIRRVLRASAVFGPLIGLCGMAYLGSLWAFHFVLTAAWSTVNIWVLEQLFVCWFQKKDRVRMIVIFFLKVLVLYGLFLTYLHAVPWQDWASAVIGGFSLPFAIMVLKALGLALNEVMGQRSTPPARRDGDFEDRSR